MEDEDRLFGLLESWYSRVGRGVRPSLSDLCAETPHLEARLRKLIAREDALVVGSGSPSPTPAEAVPVRLGDYELRELLGAGGMARVYRAEQISLKRSVALKILRHLGPTDEQLRARFRREAEITAALEHPNIVPVYETGEVDGFAFIAMKYLEGRSLDRRDEPLSPLEVARHGATLARALHAAHEVGVVHRDVKPANVIIADETPYLLDFGLARGPRSATLTREGYAPGTLAYMAPELLQGKRSGIDPRADVYALGATLHEAVTGEAPFDASKPEQLIRLILLQEPPRLPVSPRDDDLGIILRRSMDKDPHRRFPTALAMAEDLERFLRRENIVSRPTSLVTRARRMARRHRSTVIAAAVVLLATLVSLGFREQQQRRGAARDAGLVLAAEDALRSDRFEEARRQIAILARENPDHGSLARLDLELRARRIFARLLIGVYHRDEASDWTRLLAHWRELRELGASQSASSETQVLGAFIAWRLGDESMVADLLRDARVAKLYPLTGAFLSGEEGEELAPVVGSLGPCVDRIAAGDRLMAAHCVRHFGGPVAWRRRLVGSVGSSGHLPLQAMFARAMLLEDEGRSAEAEAIYASMRSLAGSPFRFLACLGMVATRLEHRRLDGVAELLEQSRGAAETLGFGILPEWQYLQVARHRVAGDVEAFWREYSLAKDRFPRLFYLDWFAGLVALGSGELERARKHLVAVREGAGPVLAGKARAKLAELDLIATPFADETEPQRLDEAERRRLEDLLARIDTELDDARHLDAKETLPTLLRTKARVARILGLREVARDTLVRALENEEDLDAAWQFVFEQGARVIAVIQGTRSAKDDQEDAELWGPPAATALDVVLIGERLLRAARERPDYPADPLDLAIIHAYVGDLQTRMRHAKRAGFHLRELEALVERADGVAKRSGAPRDAERAAEIRGNLETLRAVMGR